MDAGRVIKLVFGLIALGIASFYTVGDVYVSLTERKPAKYDVADFAIRYRGERWVELTGRLATELMVIRRSGNQAHRDSDVGYAYVPLVGAGWKPGDPVHVIITMGPFPEGEITPAVQRRADAGVVTVGGLVGPGMDRDRLFGDRGFAEPFIWVNENNGPIPLYTSLPLFLLFFGLFLWLCFVAVRAWRLR